MHVDVGHSDAVTVNRLDASRHVQQLLQSLADEVLDVLFPQAPSETKLVEVEDHVMQATLVERCSLTPLFLHSLQSPFLFELVSHFGFK